MTAIGAGLPIALNASGAAPDWIMILPAGDDAGNISTMDGRGPYRVRDPQRLIEASLQAAAGLLPIDENHSTDLAAPNGGPSPARGWATELQARPDGIWARVDWSAPGAALMSERAYRFISPVFSHDRAGNIIAIVRAALTNTPNLRGMAALHSTETDTMDLLAELRKLLGLPDDADEAAILAAIRDELADDPSTATAAALAPIAKAAGLPEASTALAIASAVATLKAGSTAAADQRVVALQSELASLGAQLTAMQTKAATERATAFVDAAIKAGRVGVKPLREHYITMHAADPARVEKEINAMPALGASGALEMPPPPSADGSVALNAAQSRVAQLLGIQATEVQKTIAAEAVEAPRGR